MNKETGGQAFASGSVRKVRSRPHDAGSDWVVSEYIEPVHPGMTLRDYFAIKALQGMLANSNTTGYDASDAIDSAWAFADKMIELRAKK